MRTIEKGKYIEVLSDEGMVLTFYNDGDDISAYDGFDVGYVKDADAVSSIREITIEEHMAYMKAKKSMFQERAQLDSNSAC